jgi:acyl-CoA thioesterase
MDLRAATATEHPLDSDTRVLPKGADDFDADLSNRWRALGGVVNGGYSVAVCLRALQEVLPHPDPLAVSTFFLRRATPGPVEVRTDVGRRGRRVSTGEARIYQEGTELLRTTATFTALHRSHGPTTVLAHQPDLPAPEECIDPIAGSPIPDVTMTDQIEFRYPTLPGWRQDQPSGDASAAFWIRFTQGRDADPLSLPLLVDAAAPVVLELGVAGSATMQLTTHVRGRPARGWLACRVTTRFVIDGYHEEDFEIWDSTGNLVAHARQLAVVLTH